MENFIILDCILLCPSQSLRIVLQDMKFADDDADDFEPPKSRVEMDVTPLAKKKGSSRAKKVTVV